MTKIHGPPTDAIKGLKHTCRIPSKRLNERDIKEFNMLNFYPNKVRGNHKHPEFTEYFLVVKGQNGSLVRKMLFLK